MDDVPVEALLGSFPPAMRRIAERLRSAVLGAEPEAIERVRPGWRLIGYDLPAGSRTTYFAFIAPEAGHVHLGFEYGSLMDDPEDILGGRDLRRVRFVTLVSGDEYAPAALDALVREGARVARMSRGERLARHLDRAAR